MPRGVPRVQPTPAWENPLDGSQTDVEVTQAGGDQDTAGSLPVTAPGPAQPDRVADALLRHLAALNSKARKVGADRDDLFLAESFRELAKAIIEERGRVRQG